MNANNEKAKEIAKDSVLLAAIKGDLSKISAEVLEKDLYRLINQALNQSADSGECQHPWHSVMGDGELSPAKCLRCGKYL